MKFWDASAIVPLLVLQPATHRMQALVEQDGTMLVWWASEVECASAIARLERDRAIGSQGAAQAFDRLRSIAAAWHEIDPSDFVRETAIRFMRVHPLRAADALQLAAAFLAAERRPSTLELVSLDDRLTDAARKEGFVVIETGVGR